MVYNLSYYHNYGTFMGIKTYLSHLVLNWFFITEIIISNIAYKFLGKIKCKFAASVFDNSRWRLVIPKAFKKKFNQFWETQILIQFGEEDKHIMLKMLLQLLTNAWQLRTSHTIVWNELKKLIIIIRTWGKTQTEVDYHLYRGNVCDLPFSTSPNWDGRFANVQDFMPREREAHFYLNGIMDIYHSHTRIRKARCIPTDYIELVWILACLQGSIYPQSILFTKRIT